MRTGALYLMVATLLCVPKTLNAQASDSRAARTPIIDMHLRADRGSARQDWSSILAAMDTHRVVLAMLSVEGVDGTSWNYDRDRFWIGPAFPCHEGQFPSRGPCFEERRGWPDLDWLREQYRSGRARWMGELLHVYDGIAPADARLEPYWPLAAELDIPVGVHIGRGPPPQARPPGCCPNFNDDFGDPALLRPVLEKHPGLRIWLMHAGGPDFGAETLVLMKDYPNVHADMSVVNVLAPEQGHAASLRQFLDAGLIDRIMLGTDNLPLGEIVRRMDAVPFLTAEPRAGIYCGNAARFLRLDRPLCEVQSGRAVADTVRVAPPTGLPGADRPNVQSAFDSVRPGGTVLFGPGTYGLGPGVKLTVPDVTVLGHPDGTTLRGCDPEVLKQRAVFECSGFYIQTERQTIRSLTFEYVWHGIVIGPYPASEAEAAAFMATGTFVPPALYAAGGHRIEGNTFRLSPNGMRTLGNGGEPSVVRDNDFIDVFHAIGMYGTPVHFRDNRITVTEPGRVPFMGHPGSAVLISPGQTDCTGHVVAGNRIEGHPDAIHVGAYRGHACRDIEIRDNTIEVRRVKMPWAWEGYAPTAEDSTMVGAPITLMNNVQLSWMPQTDSAGVLENVVVQGNRITGAEGLGIIVEEASRNRIVDNTITGIRERTPFPGRTWDGLAQRWEDANGSGVWLSAGSTHNEIAGNTFEDIAGAAVIVEGDSNRVELRRESDTVTDLGRGNRRLVVRAHEASQRTDTVHVAPPTGERPIDHASILAALREVRPGGTLQFAPGTYQVGTFIEVVTAQVTLQGHPEGTTLRGCDPAAFDDVERAIAACNGLALTGERQAVRGLTFEHMWSALWVGCCVDPAPPGGSTARTHVGGHLIEGNTFRSVVNGFRVMGDSPEPVVVRNNEFINVWHAGGVNGRTAHIIDNRITVPDPGAVPPNGFPGLAMFITAADTRAEQVFTCAGNVIAGNTIEGHPEGIAILALSGESICMENVIRDNTIDAARVRFIGTPWGVVGITNAADSTLAGVPIALVDLSREMTAVFGLPATPSDEILIRDNLIEGNRIVGAEGLGIEILRASGNRIVGNTISGVAVREPFPGNTMYVPPPWREANGSAIWVSPGSTGNEIADNTFEDVAGVAVVVEGDSNRVALRSPSDSARDLGRGNRVTRPDSGGGFNNRGRAHERPHASDGHRASRPFPGRLRVRSRRRHRRIGRRVGGSRRPGRHRAHQLAAMGG